MVESFIVLHPRDAPELHVAVVIVDAIKIRAHNIILINGDDCRNTSATSRLALFTDDRMGLDFFTVQIELCEVLNPGSVKTFGVVIKFEGE